MGFGDGGGRYLGLLFRLLGLVGGLWDRVDGMERERGRWRVGVEEGGLGIGV